MTQRKDPARNNLHKIWQHSLPARSLCLLGSFSILSSGLVLAQSESAVDNIVPTSENTQPSGNSVKKVTIERNPQVSAPETMRTTSVEQTSPVEFSSRRQRLKQRLNRSQVAESVETPKKRNASPQGVTRPQVEISTPKTGVERLRAKVEASRDKKNQTSNAPVIIPEKLPEVSRTKQPATTNNNSNSGKDYNNSYIDPTDYSTAQNRDQEAPNSVIITERSSGCQAVISQGKGTGNCLQAPITRANAPSWIKKGQNITATAAKTVSARTVAPNSNVSDSPNWRKPRIISSKAIVRNIQPSQLPNTQAVNKNNYNPNRFIPTPGNFVQLPVPTTTGTPLTASAGVLPLPINADNTAPRPGIVAYNIPLATTLPQVTYNASATYNPSGMIFPLSIPAPITSIFGWRTHPITGDQRFHSGTDVGAAEGTPVLAAITGQVEVADYVGGYGLTVILNHNSAQQTLYGHMSQVYVQPGQIVQQGTVIGLVGSTGVSTGPHLHFEVRQLTQNGWVAVDAGASLQSAVSQLVQALQTNQVSQKPSN
ncbi:M23 family metallopeptidase [Calothrix sp. PCC 6303]|uniref:M23 family metallopeptidase n=1 Tax=Calothrix sp. PCC 6303 TaxID=1170562 RepID=UPI0002A00956|nr:M23 family metallopeptidase [Calothrix sp. PCC 6303]AFZ02320.1 Peptidase M23 [Calothrix sp. PCC 6303]